MPPFVPPSMLISLLWPENADCECYRVGGVADHVYVAIRLARTVTTAKLEEELKISSSKWL